MKLRTQIVAFGLFGAALVAAAGAIGLFTASRLGQVIEATVLSGESLQASQSADMMHDAIRGDAQLATLGAAQHRPERIAEAGKGLAEHTKTLNDALVRMAGLPMTDETRHALAAVQPRIAAYHAMARAVIDAAQSGGEVAEATGAGLQTVFGELEGKLAALSESVEKAGEQEKADVAARLVQARVALVVAIAMAICAMTIAGTWLARHMARPVNDAVAAAERLAGGDLGGAIRAHGNDETTQLLSSLAQMQARFVRIVREVQQNAGQVASASLQIAHGNHDLSQRTESQASALQQTAATMDELGATVRTTADHAAEANRLVRDAAGVAGRGGEMMGDVVATMKGINDSSRRIGDIIGVIDGIAFQTNILALNAAVEAARAGEQGRGFAVVAAEVRSLAQRSAEAARQIKTLVTESVARVDQGSAIVDRAGVTMSGIVDAIGQVDTLMAGISAATAEQSAGVGQVGRAVARMDEGTQQNAALVEQSAAAADALRQQAEHLVQAVAAFRLDGAPRA
jgi:methyl-accepting chemotaxis protein-1 (serine sensor receptor)